MDGQPAECVQSIAVAGGQRAELGTEPFVADQALVWQARVGSAAAVDTVLTAEGGPAAVTPPEDWPFKRIKVGDRTADVPDVLVRGV